MKQVWAFIQRLWQLPSEVEALRSDLVTLRNELEVERRDNAGYKTVVTSLWEEYCDTHDALKCYQRNRVKERIRLWEQWQWFHKYHRIFVNEVMPALLRSAIFPERDIVAWADNSCDRLRAIERRERYAHDSWKELKEQRIVYQKGIEPLTGQRLTIETSELHHNTYRTLWFEDMERDVVALSRASHAKFHNKPN